jgi:CheY-like chemotaxis protein
MRMLLIVEDAPNLLKWLQDAVRREVPGAEAVGASNGADALALMAQRAPDLVVLDLALPAGPDGGRPDPRVGLGILDRVTALSSHPPVVVLSSMDMQQETLRRGARAFIRKDSEQMWALLREQLTST